MRSRRTAILIVGLAVVVASGAVAVARWAIAPPPAPPAGPAEYTDFEVTVIGPWVSIRNTGPGPLAALHVCYEADLDPDGGVEWYAGDQFFDDWQPGQAVLIGIPGGPAEVRAVRLVGFAIGPSFDRVYRLTYGGPLRHTRPSGFGLPPVATAESRPVEDVGFDPDLAAAPDPDRRP